MKTKENIHAGHRKRLREEIEATGIYNITDLHFLEHLLTFSIPRADTNPIAHKLLSTFKTIDNIFEATKTSLLSVDGVGPKTAELLRSMGSGCYLYNRSKALKKPYVGTLHTAISFFQNIIPPSTSEQFVILILSKDYRVKNYKIFEGVSHSSISLNLNKLSEFFILAKSEFCIFAHTHPDSSAKPSRSDELAFEELKPLYNSLGITLIDNLILGKDNYYSFRSDTYYNYDDPDLTFSRMPTKLTKQQSPFNYN